MSTALASLSRILGSAQAQCEAALEAQRAVQSNLEAARDALAAGRTAEAKRHIESALGMLRTRSFFG